MHSKVIATGSPTPRARWLRDGTEFTDKSPRIKIETNEVNATYTLTMSELREDDTGLFSCELSNCFGTEVSGSKVMVCGKPKFEKALELEKNLFEHDTACFDVLLAPNVLMPEIKWTLDDVEIGEYDHRFKGTMTSSYGYRLQAKSQGASEDMCGVLRCTASNKFGQASSVCQVSVRSPAQFKDKLPLSTRVALRKPLVLEVTFKGRPTPSVSWFLNEMEIDNETSQLIKIETDLVSMKSTVSVEAIDEEDNGTEFSCVIKNQFGEESTKTMLKVTSKPVIEKGLEDMEVEQNTTDLELCLVLEDSGAAAKATWFVDDIEIVQDDARYQAIHATSTVHKLIIKRADIGTAGSYKVVAANEFGKVESSCEVVVTSRPAFMQGFENREVVEGNEVTMDIVLSGNPAPEVSFILNDK